MRFILQVGCPQHGENKEFVFLRRAILLKHGEDYWGSKILGKHVDFVQQSLKIVLSGLHKFINKC